MKNKHNSRVTVVETFIAVTKPTPSHKNGQSRMMAQCECKCGKTFTTRLENITNGHTLSCGCWRKDVGRTKVPLMNRARLARRGPKTISKVSLQRLLTHQFEHYPFYGQESANVQ